MKHCKTLGALLGIALSASLAVPAMAGQSRTEGGVTFQITDDGIAKSLTGKPGDAANGRKLAVDRTKGGCLACHVMPIPEAPFHGKVGPSLWGVGARLDVAQLRLRVVDPKVANDATMMPAFFRSTGLHRVLKKWAGKTFLSAQEVEDMVAYLATLKEEEPAKK